MQVVVTSKAPLLPGFAEFVAYQKIPCTDIDECRSNEVRQTPLSFETCSKERQEDVRKYWAKKRDIYEALYYADNALCLNLKDVYIGGEPQTNSEYSALIGLKIKRGVTEKELEDWE